MSPELADVVMLWADQPDETIPPTPFVEENPAFASLPSQLLLADGVATMEESDAKRAAAENADEIGSRFGLANVFFAVVLLLAGITTLLSRRRLEVGILNLGIATMVGGIVILVTASGWTSLG
jgi:hypothetical protein